MLVKLNYINNCQNNVDVVGLSSYSPNSTGIYIDMTPGVNLPIMLVILLYNCAHDIEVKIVLHYNNIIGCNAILPEEDMAVVS